MPLNIGQTLQNRYRIVKLIGQGGFGAVYRAWDMVLNQPVALKENLDTSQEGQRQFQREAAMMAGLRHPNLSRVTDHFLIPGQGQYLVMDFVEGQSLADRLQQRGRPFTEQEVLPWLQQVGDGLTYLHTRQPPIIHRDIKPQNIIITPTGQAILVDFGISKVYDPNLKTTMGARAVTPGYSPPEQYGGGTSARSDVYALGATVYHLLTGQEPPESVSIVYGSATLMPPRQFNGRISPPIEQAILRAMEINGRQRFQSVADFVGSFCAPQPVPSQPLPPVRPTPLYVIPPATAAYTPLPVRKAPIKRRSFKSAITLSTIGVVALVVLPVILLLWVSLGNSPPPTPTVSPTPDPDQPLLETWTRPIDSMVMVYVPAPAATFTLGSGLEAPTEGYWIDKYEVSNSQYQLCVVVGACSQSAFSDDTDFNKSDQPVVGVSWFDAAAYAAWAGGKLPTEEEWEYAAAGAVDTAYPWGNGFDGSRLNFCDTNCGGTKVWNDGHRHTAPVGSYPTGQSWVGAADMAGNVWEWTDSWYDANRSGRVWRGGSWANIHNYARTAYRDHGTPVVRVYNVGFRVVVRRPPSHP
jgi:eukaryotic-like serine/threonine-protein kinase